MFNTKSCKFAILSVVAGTLFMGTSVGIAAEKAAEAAPAGGTVVLLSAEWAAKACEAWNANAILTGELAKSGWVDNNGGRGFKIMQIYRSECEKSPRVELRVSKKDGKAICVYGGKIETEKIDSYNLDYVMHADGKRWVEMGNGEYGPMKAMMFGRLRFEGPMMEAMGNMGPFEQFLLLPGKIPSDSKSCP
jgi:putative sterol carrier protein